MMTDHVNVGSIQVMESRHGSMTTTVIDTNGAVPMIYYMLLADIVALIVATILAAPFAREIDGHLEIALTKPISRVRFALGHDRRGRRRHRRRFVHHRRGVLSLPAALRVGPRRFQRDQLARDRDGHRRSAGLVRDALRRHDVAAPLVRRRARDSLGRSSSSIGVLSIIHPSNVVALFIHDVAWVLAHIIPFSYVSSAMPDST